MFPDLSTIPTFIRPGFTDMRKAVNGLTALIVDSMNADPLAEGLFLFCNRERKLLKAIWWDRTGFCLWSGRLLRKLLDRASGQKRLEKHKYPWPETEDAVLKLRKEELEMLLSGIDFWKAHKPLKYSKVS